MTKRGTTDKQSGKQKRRTAADATAPANPSPSQTVERTVADRLPALIERQGTEPTAEVHVTDEGVEVIEALAARGNSAATIAKHLGIGDKTLQRLRAKDERVANAWTAGRGALEDELVGHLLNAARKGNIAATIFALKSMAGYSDNPRPKEDRPPAITINLPGSMSEEAYLKMINITPEKADV